MGDPRPDEVDPVQGEEVPGGGAGAAKHEARLVGAARRGEGGGYVGPRGSTGSNVDGAEHGASRRVLVKLDSPSGPGKDAVAERRDALEVHLVPADPASIVDRAELLVAALGIGGRRHR